MQIVKCIDYEQPSHTDMDCRHEASSGIFYFHMLRLTTESELPLLTGEKVGKATIFLLIFRKSVDWK